MWRRRRGPMEWFAFMAFLCVVGVGLRIQALEKDLKARHEELLARFDRVEARRGEHE
jgi:hypothetical protein